MKPERLDPYEEFEASEQQLAYEDERERRNAKAGAPFTAGHATRYRCFRCGGLLGDEPAEGIGDALYHPICFRWIKAERDAQTKEK